ncbi:MAG: hypothetical protein ACRYHQ_39655 [Janthinobacterium lividum]
MRTAILLSPEVADAIGAIVTNAYETLEIPTLPPDPARGVTDNAAVF